MIQRNDESLPAAGEGCPLCGYVMEGYQCKLVCPNCGYREDCSDTFLAGPREAPREYRDEPESSQPVDEDE